MDWPLIENAAPYLLTAALALSIPALFIALSALLGPRKKTPAKVAPYECGIAEESQVDATHTPFQARFFLVAVFFLVFDVEVAFLFPWAVWFRSHGWEGLAAMGAFLLVLAFGWLYVVQRGGLEWE